FKAGVLPHKKRAGWASGNSPLVGAMPTLAPVSDHHPGELTMNSYDILGDFGGGVLNPNYNPEQSPFSSLKYPLHAETIYALTDSGEAPSGARFAYGKLK